MDASDSGQLFRREARAGALIGEVTDTTGDLDVAADAEQAAWAIAWRQLGTLRHPAGM